MTMCVAPCPPPPGAHQWVGCRWALGVPQAQCLAHSSSLAFPRLSSTPAQRFQQHSTLAHIPTLPPQQPPPRPHPATPAATPSSPQPKPTLLLAVSQAIYGSFIPSSPAIEPLMSDPSTSSVNLSFALPCPSKLSQPPGNPTHPSSALPQQALTAPRQPDPPLFGFAPAKLFMRPAMELLVEDWRPSRRTMPRDSFFITVFTLRVSMSGPKIPDASCKANA